VNPAQDKDHAMPPEGPLLDIAIAGRSIRAPAGLTVMEALAAAAILLRSDCGGRGRCGKCRVATAPPDRGALSAPDESEVKALGAEQLAGGLRLACRAAVLRDVALEVPADSLLSAEVVQKGLPLLPARLAAAEVGAGRGRAPEFGIAVDLGTTTVAVYLCDRANNLILGSTSARNPQALFGDDVISRISAVREDAAVLPRLQTMAARAVDWAVAALCRRLGIDPQAVGTATLVGNSTMVHLLLGEDPSSIGVFPYAPKFVEARERTAAAVGLSFNPAARLRTLPLISGYLGADILSAALAADLTREAPGTLLVDVGTNGEIFLATESGLAAASCATGPAFEGAAIRHGMQATSGAIDAVRFDPRRSGLDYTVIRRNAGPAPRASGICGSGVISAVAELLRAGVISKSGRFEPAGSSPFLRRGENGAAEFEIVPAEASGAGRPITLTQADIRAVQLAKGALRTGIELLCREQGLPAPTKILLAGAFGSYIRKADALAIGMFPPIAPENIATIGNAAGAGAVLALFDESVFASAGEMAQATRVLDLASHPDFQETFIRSLSF
jgi:uncharacterized 2Fe-2S/4Fe-4S cluster protein (DUF4445 family)